ncbi:Met30p [Sugiyamaella lignohabitans]|uniref:Met30p n=1 Tax=Sugiyamaella lignohabitans TaxID=796027 RepID=A0A167DGB2_9ASCO|nr:Met30p [Sugiyamaella lignohabitans]ANB12884.1 Met30p [Sugiyamaella lignohabitans]
MPRTNGVERSHGTFGHGSGNGGGLGRGNLSPEEQSPRASQESVGIISWQNGTIPKIRIRIPSNTRQKLARVINKTLPAFIINGLNEVNISGLPNDHSSGLSSGFSNVFDNGQGHGHGRGNHNNNLESDRTFSTQSASHLHTGGFANTSSRSVNSDHVILEGLAVPSSSHHSLHHARSTLSFESVPSMMSRASQRSQRSQPVYDIQGSAVNVNPSGNANVSGNVNSSIHGFGVGTSGNNTGSGSGSGNGSMGAPITRYYSWTSTHSGIPSPIHNITIRSVSASCGGVPKLQSDRDSTKSTTFGETESGIAFLYEGQQSIASSQDDDRYDPVKHLPAEIVAQVFRNLDVESINTCRLLSRTWKHAVESDSVWRQKFYANGWEATSDVLEPGLYWEQLFRTRYILEQRWLKGAVSPKVLAGHADGVYCVHMDNEKIVTGSRDRMIKIWDLETGKLLQTLGGEGQNNIVRRTRRSLPLNEAQDRGAGDHPATIQHTGSILCLALDDSIMVSGSSDSSCIIWQLPKFKPLKQVYRHSDGVLDVCLSKDYIVSCSKDATISIWDRNDPNYTLKYRLHGHRGPVNAIDLRGDYLFSASGDGFIKMWSVSTGTWIRDFQAHSKGLACVQASDDCKTIVSGGTDNVIRLWDVETSQCVRTLTGHKGLVRSLYILGDKIISGSYDQSIHIWDINTGKLLTNLSGWHGSWIFSAKADCKRIVSTSFGTKPVILDFSYGLDKRYLKCIQK